MEKSKISFGFKINKKPEILPKKTVPEKQVELIDCLEGQSIKIKNAVKVERGPLIIPVASSSKNLIERVKEAKEKRIKTEIKQEDTVPDSALSIDELAARELIREAQNRETEKLESKVSTLVINTDKFVAEGEAEPSLEDYESVPISDYGKAMLRGMGWQEGMPIGKTRAGTVVPLDPEIRPKGLGLGANKMIKASKPTSTVDKNGKQLQLVKGAFGKIIAGNHRGHYCEVQGLDDENCRIVVKTAVSNEVLSLNEFLIVPVTKDEYTIGSKIINHAKYEAYKERERSRSGGRQKRSSSRESRDRKREKKKSKKKKKHRSQSDSEEDRGRRRRKHKSRRRESSESDREHGKSERRRK